MIKKRIMTGLCLMLCLFLLSHPLAASAVTTPISFSLSVEDGDVGDTVTVSVSISADSTLTNTTLYIHYDSAVVSFVKEGTGSACPSGAMFLANDISSSNYVKSAFISITPTTAAGVLVTYDFKVLQHKAASFTLTLEECQGGSSGADVFDLEYTISNCVLNEDAGPVNPVTTKATTAKPTTKSTTKPKATTKAPVTTTKASTSKVNVPTTTVTYPTDDHGITLAPHVVTQADGNAVTEPNGAVVTMTTTTVATTTTTQDASSAISGEIIDTPAPPSQSNWVTPVVVIVICLLIGGGVTAAGLLMRKKKAAPDDSAPSADE